MSELWPKRQRTAERVRLEIHATLHREGETDVPVAVSDLSSAGCNLACDAFLPIGSPVILDIPGAGQIPATVAWQLGGKAGLEFAGEIGLKRMIETVLAALANDATDDEDGVGEE